MPANPATASAQASSVGPVLRRYFDHALPAGPYASQGVRLTMRGRIKAGLWLPFTADQEGDGRSFTWRARCGWGPIKPLTVVDRFDGGQGSIDGRIFGRLRLFHAEDENTSRSAAGRAVAEGIFSPASLIGDPEVQWAADPDDGVTARREFGGEFVELRITTTAVGAVTSIRLERWGKVGKGAYGYIPFGADVHEERRFGSLVIPSRVTAGWWHGTPKFQPFFEASITSAVDL